MIDTALSVQDEIRVLLIEDREDDALLILSYLTEHGFRVTADRIDDFGALKNHLKNQVYDTIISEYSMPTFTATHALQRCREMAPDTPFLIVSGQIDEEIAVSLVKQGASDFLNKDRLGRVGIAVESAIQHRDLVLAEREAKAAKRAADEHLRHSDKIEAIGRLAGGIAHDFNNLLSVILNYSDFVIEGFSNGGPHEEDVREIRAAAERGAGLTRQLLAFSRKELIKPQILDLGELFHELRSFLDRTIGEDIALEIKCSEDLWPVEADQGHIEQVLLNLAVNARDAMTQGGALSIRAENRLVADEDAADGLPSRCVEISVTDTGGGIPDDLIGRIFEPFFTTKPNGQGTGLGLATVQGIVEQWDGSIHVESHEGIGTTFEISIPASEMGLASATAELACKKPAHVPTILVVEDETPVRSVIQRALQIRGYEVLTAATGEEALAIFQKEPEGIDLVITDVVMPGMSGRELAGHLSSSTHGPKLIFMSGYLGDVLLRQGIATERVDYLSKPFDPASLNDTVERVLAV